MGEIAFVIRKDGKMTATARVTARRWRTLSRSGVQHEVRHEDHGNAIYSAVDLVAEEILRCGVQQKPTGKIKLTIKRDEQWGKKSER